MKLRILLTALACLGGAACNSETPSSADATTSPVQGGAPAGSGDTRQPAPSPTTTPGPSPTPTTTPRPSPVPSPSPIPTLQPVALVYGGPGVLFGTDDTLDMAKAVAAKAGFKVVVVDDAVEPAVLDGASVWIQPGGPNLSADSYMNNTGMTRQVRDFVQRGGGFVGFCGGAFSAVNNLDLIHGSAWNLSQSTKKIPINWLGTTRYLHFEHGPYILLEDDNAEVVGTYSGGKVAAVRSRYGKGKVFISGPHPEAAANWPPTADPDGLDHDLAVSMIREVAAIPEP